MIGFAVPWLLSALAALPLLWLLLRAVPPAPKRHRFAAVTLLLGLKDKETEADTTPLWLLLLRAMAVAALIIGCAGPFWHQGQQAQSDKPLLILMDGGWSDAPDWPIRLRSAEEALGHADRAGRVVAFHVLSKDMENLAFSPAGLALPQIRAAIPHPWSPQIGQDFRDWITAQDGFDTFWVAAPAAYDGQENLLAMLMAKGHVTVFETGRGALVLAPPSLTPDGVEITLRRSGEMVGDVQTVLALGPDPSGQQRSLAQVDTVFESGSNEASANFDMPPELRERVTRYVIDGHQSAGAVTLSDDSLKRQEIALLSATAEGQEGLALLSQLHYLRQAMVPTADLVDGAMQDILQANPDTIILADVPRVTDPQAVLDWVEKGGALIRFAGPRLAAASFDASEDDPLLPVRLRGGGRAVGGAMSWGAPKTLRVFALESPFYGLVPPEEVTIKAQVLAEPGPDLASKVIARLQDGTPLVTRKKHGQGQIVLFHVTANAEWSNLPLSGLFMQMMQRLSVVRRAGDAGAMPSEGTTWTQNAQLDAYGVLKDTSDIGGIDGADFQAPVSAALPPGLYQSEANVYARNVIRQDTQLTVPQWPQGVTRVGPDGAKVVDLKPYMLALAGLLICVDMIAALWLTGRLRRAAFALLIVLWPMEPAQAEDIDSATILAANKVVLAYVITGDTRQDEISLAGMNGLSETLFFRTAIEPARAMGLDLSVDDLSLYPFLYWPITDNQEPLSAGIRRKLNRYLQAGGFILFDTRDADLSGLGRTTPQAQKLKQIAAGLEIPPLAPISADHVLTRSFYLIQDFPGRQMGGTVWVEASGATDQADGAPFRLLNDGVTPVLIGGNDWAAAWALDDLGDPLLPVGRGFAGDQQREYAFRFGVNLIMHVLTGNYKSDQIHVPALLDRLGQ